MATSRVRTSPSNTVSKTRRVPQRARAIRRLAKLRETFEPDAAAERERLLRACGRARCRSGKELSSSAEEAATIARYNIGANLVGHAPEACSRALAISVRRSADGRYR